MDVCVWVKTHQFFFFFLLTISEILNNTFFNLQFSPYVLILPDQDTSVLQTGVYLVQYAERSFEGHYKYIQMFGLLITIKYKAIG